MDRFDQDLAVETGRRRLLTGALAACVAAVTGSAPARSASKGAASDAPLTNAFPQKREMLLRRVRPPLLETPMAVFDADVITPNDRFFVRWHWADIPTSIDVERFRLSVSGHVRRPLSLSLAQLLRLRRVRLTAVNQCSGNGRRLFRPAVPGAQWSNGAMGNAEWLGVALRDVLEIAGVRAGAGQVRFDGLDRALVAGAPDYRKALDIDHARDGEVMIAFAMNGEQLPLLNGFPCRLIVPGWYSTYWVKMLSSIEVLASADDGYWMAKAYKIPTAPRADVPPGAKGFPTVPINRMVPRSWLTSLQDGQRIAFDPVIPVGGIAMGGDCGVARVDVSADGGRTWIPTRLGADHGRYSFRRWDGRVPLPGRGRVTLMSRCWNTAGAAQPFRPVWNPSGYMRGNVEATTVVVS